MSCTAKWQRACPQSSPTAGAPTPTGNPCLGGAPLDPHSLFLPCAGARAAGPHTFEGMGGEISPARRAGVLSLAPFQRGAQRPREPNPPGVVAWPWGRGQRKVFPSRGATGTGTPDGSRARGSLRHRPVRAVPPGAAPAAPPGPPAGREAKSAPAGAKGRAEPCRAGAGAGGEALALICIRYNALWWRSWLGRARPAARSSRGRGGAGRREASGGRAAAPGGWCPS